MKAEDLRIGNYYIDYGGKIMAVDLNFFNLLWLDVDVDEIIKEFIPLTEEWLLKLSFTHCMPFDPSKPFYFEKSGLKLVQVEFSNDGSVKKTGYVVDGLIGVCDLICTVHHLQNVFYFLTGEELQIIS